MTTINKLSIEEVEQLIDIWKPKPATFTTETSRQFSFVYRQLADTMRENERFKLALRAIQEYCGYENPTIDSVKYIVDTILQSSKHRDQFTKNGQKIYTPEEIRAEFDKGFAEGQRSKA